MARVSVVSSVSGSAGRSARPQASALTGREALRHRANTTRRNHPALAELRRDESEAGEDRRGERDHEAGDLLRGAARFHPRGDDHRDAPRRHQIQQRQDDDRVEQWQRQSVRDALRAVAIRGQPVPGRERDDAGDHHRHDHPDELSEDDVEVSDRRSEEGDESPVLLLGREGRRDERDAGERGEEHALERESYEREVALRSGRDAAIREDEEERDHDEDARPKERGAIEEDLPTDLAPRDEPPLHRRASARMLRYASSSERSSAESVTTRRPASSSARSAAGFTEPGSSAAKRSANRPSRALASSARIPARASASRAMAGSPANATVLLSCPA